MKISEKELRNVIAESVKKAIMEFDAKAAQRYIDQDNGAGFTTNQNFSTLFGQFKQILGAKKDVNGQMDWQNSANEIQNLIGQCKNEVKRLQRIYRGISGYQAKQMSAQSLQKGKATRAANAIARQNNPNAFLKPQYGTVGQGSADVTGQAEKLGSLRKTTRPQAQGWIGSTNESLEEGIFNRTDEVDKICKNWRSYVGNKDAAAKVQDRISKYQTMIQQLQAIIDKGVSRGHITDVNADARSAAKAAGYGSAQQQYKQVAEAVERALRKVLSE